MLKQINCEIFREKGIIFHEGLNVVLGDNLGSNSIGKSTLLMIIDFVFGGNTYITHNKDVVTRLGHHEFFYHFEFNKIDFYFSRGTLNPDKVFTCDTTFRKINPIDLEEYYKFLQINYGFQSEKLTFRAAVSPFSRVWGKNNYDVKRPLHAHHSEAYLETVNKLIKMFNEYHKIEIQDTELKRANEEKKIFKKASDLEYIPKITKTKYQKNLKQIEEIKKEIAKLAMSPYSPFINVSDIISDELIELRERKRILLSEREHLKSRLIRSNKGFSKTISVEFENLLEFFPQVNIQKLDEIERFHNGISNILSVELEQAKKNLRQRIDVLDNEIAEINNKMEKLLNPEQKPNIFIDNLLDASVKLKNLEIENNYYIKSNKINANVDTLKESLNKLKESIIENISKNINSKLVEINEHIYMGQRMAPELLLKSKDYEYQFFDNTGTGKAYANLIIFDIAIFQLTELPIITHDSFLFKNIEQPAMEKILNLYDSNNKKQVFIAIDSIHIFSEETQLLLQKKKVIQLDNSKLLFTLDWRNMRTDDN
ncbi:DUF2326 domain-containing protein [Paenibacillus sediminis]|uniref:ElaB/YqjD/DUF883 family membrane-anchored ribosome-binding protein/chaperonin cofactor prefoldin n=1 Tax=Paenibacillus sediminis TaxID=664909 RepID=A0ABS4H7D2_9BACL|nr:DUF2326 domain-containing protein [Paenibacillus sediminis]MBP1937975.1 ElaB/YqjD/DUF883 family membrane-anchored ribosome-binding protein/chaperonin cofactor prefoldin [Paenibacillus sediminis]